MTIWWLVFRWRRVAFHGHGFEFGEIGQRGLHAFGGHVELRGPDDGVEDEAAQVFVAPVLVEVRHHDAETASTVVALDAPGDGFTLRMIRVAASRWPAR
jgi:hypothetical protein